MLVWRPPLLADVRLKSTHQARLRKAIAASAVVLLHVVAIRALLDVRALLDHLAEKREKAITWIILPPDGAPANSVARGQSPPSSPGLPMAPLVDKAANPTGLLALGQNLALTPFTLPSFPAPENLDARVSSALTADFACNFVDYDRLTDAEKSHCALRLSNLGDIEVLPQAYADLKGTPFTLFGTHGTFSLTPPTQRPFDLLALSAGCSWEQGLCRRPEPPKFGLDPDDQTRLSAAAHFELAKGLSLDVGAQGYMENYLGGARPILTVGVVLAYRW
jgi:hypothetical protein